MKRIVTALLTIAIVFGPASLEAQQESRDDLERELRSMVVGPSEADRDRQRLQDFLDLEEVQAVATEHGIDADRLRDRVATMDDASTSELADRVQDAQDDLDQVGGDTFVITSTTVIIALLVIILILVA